MNSVNDISQKEEINFIGLPFFMGNDKILIQEFV